MKKKLYLPGARNKGIENASGEWIFFIDDDDEATPSFIKWLNKDKQNKKYDFYRFPKITRTKEGDKKNPNIFIKSNIWTIQLSTYLFRREFLIKNNMKFDEEIKAYFEDVLFHQLLYSRHPRTKYKSVYSIFYNTTNFVSITREKSYFEIDEFFIFLDMIDSRKYISKNAIFKILIDAYYTASIHKKGQTEQLKVQRQILPYIIKYDIRFTDMFKGYWISWFHYLKFYLKVSKLKNKK